MPPSIVVYGATAFAAATLLTYLDTHPDGHDFNFILAGRNRSSLETANAKLSRQREIIVVELSDEQGVRELVGKADVVMNLAGPFGPHNAIALIKCCAETGTHYVDISAEATWLATAIIPKYDYLASKTGACIVPSCGFDSVPSDLVVYHALQHLQTVSPGASIKQSTSFFRLKGTFSGGTLATLADRATPPIRRDTPRTQLLYTLSNPSLPRTMTGSYFFMYPHNRCIVRRSWWLSRIPISSFLNSNASIGDSNEPKHGDEMVYRESLEWPNSLMAYLASGILFGFAGLFFASRVFRRFMRWLLPPGSGASLEELKRGSSKITNVSISDSNPPIQILTTAYGEGDPGYLNTGHLVAESALSLILQPPKGTSLPPLGRVGGVLTPSTAMGMVLVERLKKSGKFVIHTEVINGTLEREGKKRI
ncbi:MAG: hypothetical protein TREMPRED_003372 [Tremellales sp. Tagirdzhanova-0007]|nr:MAG: hypothetical protein TREMPRED_003372 [Tremellales sp. Tagirdzhanova-0007]